MMSNTDSPLSIIYQDEEYIAINKPPGLLVHRTAIDSQETQFAVQLLRDQIGQHVFPVHRLDKPTSGALLFALNESALSNGQKAFEMGQVHKTYHAIVRGHPAESGVVDHPLRKMLDQGPKAKSDTAQEAKTLYRTRATVEHPIPTERYPKTRYAWVELDPKTGRRHQLRRHLSHIDCPIIGDTKHGDTRRNLAFKERYGFVRLFLHASSISLVHPFSQEGIEIEASLWPDFQVSLEATGLTQS